MSERHIADFEGWIGVDCDTETSLFDYGFLFNPNAPDNECNIVYKLSGNGKGSRFAFSSFYFSSILDEDWIDWGKVIVFGGCTMDDVKDMIKAQDVSLIQLLLPYYGSENVLGSAYHKGFTVKVGSDEGH